MGPATLVWNSIVITIAIWLSFVDATDYTLNSETINDADALKCVVYYWYSGIDVSNNNDNNK